MDRETRDFILGTFNAFLFSLPIWVAVILLAIYLWG